jgi:long-chain acyl-CoA synthetase
LCDYAIWSAGAVTVPIYETSSAEQTQWILADSGAVAVLVENDRHEHIIDAVRPSLADLAHVWGIDRGDIATLGETGRDVGDDVLAQRRAALRGADLATIVYTSGTTGRPKGCPLTHANLMADCLNVTAAPGVSGILNENASTLMFLPLAHSLARIIQIDCVHARAHIGYTPDTKELPADLASFRPTIILAVPRVFEKLYNTAQRTAHEKNRAARLVFARAERIAIRYSEALDKGGPGRLLRLEHTALDRLVYKQIRGALGGRVRWSVSGGAPLGARLGHFFRGMGVCVLEGYGLTETATGGTLNLPSRVKVGTVGPPIPSGSVRIAPDGEILLHGPFVFAGYWHNELATAEAFDEDGWFRTGDLGTIDPAGFVSITGRKKELIVTSGGKNVAPTVLEDRLRAHWLVSQCMVIGDRRPYISAVITLDGETIGSWQAEHGKTMLTPAELCDDPQLRQELQRAVDTANEAVSQAESIRRFLILDADFTEAGGQLTPTLKLKRDLVGKQYHDQIESLYEP